MVVLFIILILFSILWFFIPWDWRVGLFVGGLAFLWLLFFTSLISRVGRRHLAAAFLLSFPLMFAGVFQPLFLWYALAPLAAFVWLVYVARERYGWLYGFLFVVLTLWLHVVLQIAADVASGGLLTKAYGVGLHPHERWNIPVIVVADAASLYASAELINRLFRRFRR